MADDSMGAPIHEYYVIRLHEYYEVRSHDYYAARKPMTETPIHWLALFDATTYRCAFSTRTVAMFISAATCLCTTPRGI